MKPDLRQRLASLYHLIGHTPMLRMDLKYRGQPRTIYAKLESYNFSGSIKDRMAYHVLSESIRQGLIHEGSCIAEATSGNTGIAFTALGSFLGLKTTIFMPDWMSEERKSLIRSLGADIRLVSREEGGFLTSIARAETMARESDCVFLPRQFSNPLNSEAHAHSTGPEIWQQLQSVGLEPDAFVAGVGTGGTIMGTGTYLRERNPHIKLHPLEPASSPTLSTGHKVGSHRIQGISDDFIPDLLKLGELDEVVSADDGDAVIMAQKLIGRGISVGISSGANLIGALKAQDRLGPDAVVVTVFSDDNKKYLSTDLVREERVKEGFYSSEVEFKEFSLIRPA